ncbi:MAG: polysaccharide biosynthesis/export family protein [Kiritimatiellia bacterium]
MFSPRTETAEREQEEIEPTVSETASEAITSDWSPLTIRPGSLLNIRVYVGGSLEVDISSTRVSEAGTVTLPIIGTTTIGGRPLRTAAQLVELRYREYFVSPQVTMDLVRDDDSDAFPWGFVTVLGRVKKQGRVAIPPTRDLTVSSAIQQAGGFDTSARITAIRVTRRLSEGESQTFDVNMRNIGRRGRTDQDILLQPNDVIFIPEMLF